MTKPNISRWAQRGQRTIQKESNPNDPINILSDLMGDDYWQWYRNVPLPIQGDLAKLRAAANDKITKIHKDECNDNGFDNCYCGICNPPAPTVDDEELIY